MKTVLVAKNVTESAETAIVELKFFSKDKVDVTTHLVYNMQNPAEAAAFEKSRNFFKVGKTYIATFSEPKEETPASGS